MWGIYYWHTVGPLVPIEHHLITEIYLSVVAQHVHPFMTKVCYPLGHNKFSLLKGLHSLKILIK